MHTKPNYPPPAPPLPVVPSVPFYRLTVAGYVVIGPAAPTWVAW